MQEKHEAYISLVDDIVDEFEEKEDEWMNDIKSTFEDMERKKVAVVRLHKGLEEQKKTAAKDEISNAVDNCRKLRTMEEFSIFEEVKI